MGLPASFDFAKQGPLAVMAAVTSAGRGRRVPPARKQSMGAFGRLVRRNWAARTECARVPPANRLVGSVLLDALVLLLCGDLGSFQLSQRRGPRARFPRWKPWCRSKAVRSGPRTHGSAT